MQFREPGKKIQKTACAITRVSDYDNYFGFLTAAVIVIALLVSMLFGIWLAGFDSAQTGLRAVPWTPAGIPDEALKQVSAELEIEKPGFREFPEAQMPRQKQSLLARTHTISNVSAHKLAKPAGDQEEGKGTEGGDDKRQEGFDSVPVRRRFVINYGDPKKIKKEDYFRKLAFFNVYLGAVKRSTDQIQFLEKLGSEEPEVSKGNRKSEKATLLYFRIMTQPMRGWDEEMMKKHGIDIEGTLPVQFYPEETQKILIDLEVKKLAEEGKELSEVYQTKFGVKAKGDGFEYFVVEIEYK